MRWGDGLKFIVVMHAQLCEHTKKLSIVGFKGMDFMVYELYLNKIVKNNNIVNKQGNKVTEMLRTGMCST